MKRLGIALFILGALPLWSIAPGATLSVRLVVAHNENNKISKALQDVRPTLQRNLGYTGYDLLTRKDLKIPPGGTVDLGSGFQLKCSGSQKSLRVKLTRNKKRLFDTTLNLRKGKPVILGGFKVKRGRAMVILVSK